jgi:hypothetical protein
LYLRVFCLFYVDSSQLLLQLEQEKGEKQKLDWLVSEGKKQVRQHAGARMSCALPLALAPAQAHAHQPVISL